MHFAPDDEMDVSRLFKCIIDDGQVHLVGIENVWVLLARVIRTVEAEVEVEDELALEVKATLVQNI